MSKNKTKNKVEEIVEEEIAPAEEVKEVKEVKVKKVSFPEVAGSGKFQSAQF